DPPEQAVQSSETRREVPQRIEQPIAIPGQADEDRRHQDHGVGNSEGAAGIGFRLGFVVVFVIVIIGKIFEVHSHGEPPFRAGYGGRRSERQNSSSSSKSSSSSSSRAVSG